MPHKYIYFFLLFHSFSFTIVMLVILSIYEGVTSHLYDVLFSCEYDANEINIFLTFDYIFLFSDFDTHSMASLFLKCIPCARSGRVPISENYEISQPTKLYAKKSNEPVERPLCQAPMQKTPLTNHARGFEIVEMGTVGTENGSNTVVKTSN